MAISTDHTDDPAADPAWDGSDDPAPGPAGVDDDLAIPVEPGPEPAETPEDPEDAEPGPPPPWIGTLEGILTLVVVAGAALFVFAQFQPDLLFSSTTPAGGDMGAHVWAPTYLRDHLLTKGRLTGWTPDWYAGFPAMQFYMVVPMLAIVALSYILPYGVAFKLVTVAGVITLPVSAYLFGRLTRLPFPVPAFLAVGATLFVFDRSYSIYGGNAASTLAGEFAFSISLSIAILYLGVVGRGMAEGTHRALAAVLLALAGLCHIIPTFFAIAGTLVWFGLHVGRDLYEGAGSLQPDRWSLFWRGTRARAWWLVSAAGVAGLLAAFWVLPFYAKSQYLNDMGWEKKEDWGDLLFWRQNLGGGGLIDYPTLAAVIALALIGFAISIALRNRPGLLLSGLAVMGAVGFRYVPQGRLWNTRLLPFYYLTLTLLAALALGMLPELLRRRRARRWVAGLVLAGTVALQVALVVTPQSPIGTVDWLRPQWSAYVYIGLALAVVVGAAELISMPTGRRRTVSWCMVGAAAAFQLLMLADDDARSGVRLLGWTVCLLALVSISALAELALGRRPGSQWVPGVLRVASALAVVLVAFVYAGLPMRSLGWFGQVEELNEVPTGEYSLRIPGTDVDLISTRDDSFVDGWAAWNYRGYESPCGEPDFDPCVRGRKSYFPEYEAVVETMAQVGEEHGCGRAMWEYSGELDRYGTPMALMLLPHWTDGCIGSMEGLYFEASTTTPYHFLNQDELSVAGSNAQRGLPYGPGAPTRADFDRGIAHLQMLGVKYYMAYSPEMTEFARTNPELTEVATSPSMCRDGLCPDGIDEPPDRWVIFEVADSQLVAPLPNQPVVLTGVGKGHTCDTVPIEEDPRGRECRGWLDPAVDWYVDESLWNVPLAASGPDDWDRIPVDEWMATHDAPTTSLDPVEVSDVWDDDDEIGFTVDQVGVPVVVRASYFPNWKVDGAEGPYRLTPNTMVVVPTENEVRLHYGTVAVDYIAWALTFLGLGLLVVLVRRAPIAIPAGPVAVWRTRRAVGEPGAEPDAESGTVPEAGPRAESAAEAGAESAAEPTAVPHEPTAGPPREPSADPVWPDIPTRPDG